MGIKGIYKEIGPGKRVSLCKLAIDHLEQTGQPLRLAIDFAIWSFQAQATRGGANPAIRTLFYRLVRLLSLSIVPLFVFDGPKKPFFKRNKRSRGPGDNVSVAMAKRLIKHFGLHIHDAPGEAEAECALLQQQGVVDAVLSEDVDTIMFGCTFTLRNWSAEGSRAAKTPTHVSVYDVAELKRGETGLDREGMVLVALMSGGDYNPEGVPGCGVKVACEAARAGFGRRLCRIKRSDPEALASWRKELMEELRTNKSQFFRTRHKALAIPEDFPSVEVLRYYTHPVVSQAATVDKLKREFPKKKAIDIEGLRAFTAETFDWVYKIGAVKFIRVLAPSLLVQALLSLSYEELETDDPDVRQEVEGKLVRSINIRRTHLSTDGTPELRVSYIPNDVVGIDLDAEEDEVASTYGRSGLALNSDDEVEEQVEDAESGPKKVFDPLQPDLAWVPETLAKLGVPLAVEDWEEKQRLKQRGKPKTQAKGLRKKASEMPVGALDKYVKTKHTASNRSKPTKPKTKENLPRLSLDVNPWTLTSSQATPKAKRPAAVPEAIYISSSPTSPQGPGPLEVAQSSALSRLDDSFQNVPPSSPDPLSPISSPSMRKNVIGVLLSPRKHNCPSEEQSKRSTSKRTHKPIEAVAVRGGSPTRRSTRSRRTPDAPAQASIKTFGRLSEAMGKKNTVPKTKAADPLSDSDDELEELHKLGSNVTSQGAEAAVAFSRRSTSQTLDNKDGSASLLSRNGAEEVVEIPSSPLACSPPRAVPIKSKTTSLYVPRTSDAGYGYFKEIEVSLEAADRMIAGQSREPRRSGSKRIWRQSEVSILDLTGED
ncbi:hypothetical protein VP1G_05324 [Cytospora mali]|uniref:Flap endonuclease GEN 1 n=1 Tax=Cytospora mali TaxID=578113 RepID=A0A194V281_CYTMA|nr:hypothetical protein VP1G_05324 [Valsa mali var. pyri (nom. inval.)]